MVAIVVSGGTTTALGRTRQSPELHVHSGFAVFSAALVEAEMI
jgi:hypothetical protein